MICSAKYTPGNLNTLNQSNKEQKYQSTILKV